MPAYPRKPLTVAFVRSAKVPGRYFDGHGLILRVAPSGARQWIQRIVVRGKRSEIGLGSAEMVSLGEARSRAYANRQLARAGGDPLAERRKTKSIPTFEEAARMVHEASKPTWRNEKHGNDFIRSLELYAFSMIGSRKVSEVTSADVLAVMEPIWTVRQETARRVLQRLGTILKWAIAKGYRTDNPAAAASKGLPKHDRKSERKHRKALHYNEVSTCLASVRASGAWLSTKLAIEFLVLTAARSGEVRLATGSVAQIG